MSFRRFVELRGLLQTSARVAVLSAATATLAPAEPIEHSVKEKEPPHGKFYFKPTEGQIEERDSRRHAITAGVINNPAVTLGMFLTVCALVGMIRKSYVGDRMGTQQYMQYRIMAQFFTLMALIAGVGYYSIQARRDADAAKTSAAAALATAEAVAQTAAAAAAVAAASSKSASDSK